MVVLAGASLALVTPLASLGGLGRSNHVVVVPARELAATVRLDSTASSGAVGTDAGNTSQQCGGITDPLCYVIDAFISGPVAIMGSIDGSPDPAHIAPGSGAMTSGPWRLITTLVGSNPAVDDYNGSWGEPAHDCGRSGCIPWVQQLNSILVPISLSLLVLAFTIQVTLFMVGQQLNLRAGIVPCLVAAGVIGAGLPLHLAGRIIDAGTWASQGLLQATFARSVAQQSQPIDLMTVLAITAYCPEDSPVIHPGIHLALPGPSPADQVLVQPWMDPHFTQSHCIGSGTSDFTKEVLNRSENFFGPPLHDANCDRGNADPSQPACTVTDNQVNDNTNQDCLEGSGSPDLGAEQLHLLPLPGEPRAGNGQSPSDCRYADIYWGTVASFTDVWSGVGPHGRNGYDVPDGIQGMVAFTVLTVLALWLALTYLARYIALALLAGSSSLAFLLLALPGGRGVFSRYWRTVAELSAVVVLQTLIFLVFVAIVSTVSGLAPHAAAADLGGCPLISSSATTHCAAGASGLLSEVGSGDPGDQFAKCLMAIVTVWLMLEVPRRISRGELATASGLRTLAAATGGVVVGGATMARGEIQPRVARFGSRVVPAGRSLMGLPGPTDHELASRLEQGELSGSARWPAAPGRESRDQFIGRALVEGRVDPSELHRLLGLDGQAIAEVKTRSQLDPASTAALGLSYVAAGGSRVHELDAAYLNALRRSRLHPASVLRGDK